MFRSIRKTEKAEALGLPWNSQTRRAFNGRWCALAECVYSNDGHTQRATLIDQDGDLASLCQRIERSGRKCDIVFCD